MGFFEDFIGKAKSAASAAGKKTSELVELSKLKISEAETKHDIDKKFEELGRSVYKAQWDENEPEFVKALKAEISQLYDKLNDIQVQIAAVKNQVKCRSCGNINVTDSKFCNKCGNPLGK